jgi:hypothetical protein
VIRTGGSGSMRTLFGPEDPWSLTPSLHILMPGRRDRGVAVDKTTVVLGPFSNETFAEGLRVLLSRSANFRVLTVDDPASLVTGMEPDTVALVVEGTDPTTCRRYLTLKAVRRVVIIDLAAALAFVGMDNPRWEDLENVVRTAVADVDAPDEDQVRVLDATAFTTDRSDDVGTDHRDLDPLMRWIELCLVYRLSQRYDDGSPGVPGWSVSAREALNMLVLGLAEEIDLQDHEGLTTRLNRVDDDLFATGRTLPRVIADVQDSFALSDDELRILCLSLAPELDGRYATAIGVLQDDLTRRRSGLTLMAELLPDADVTTWDLRVSLHRRKSLVAQGLVRLESDGLDVDSGLVPSAAVVAYLLCPSPEEASKAIGAQWRDATAAPEPPLSSPEEGLARQLRRAEHDAGTVQLAGGDQPKQWFRRLAGSIGMALVVGDLDATESRADRPATVSDWSVLSRLLNGTLLLLGTHGLSPTERARVAENVQEMADGGRIVVIDGDIAGERRETSGLILAAPETTAAQRGQWWSTAAHQAGLPLKEGDIERLAATVNLEPSAYASAVGRAVRLTAAGVDGTLVELVQRSAREMARRELPPGARRIDPVYGWDDIVVGAENRALLESIPQHVLYYGRVMEDWGFSARLPYGDGLAALFSGPSGTGKTMAAQIIARYLGVGLLQVDLSKTVSKYIGDTEKNLDLVFEAAECSGAVLLFDEADAIFGRRTEVKDAHDRHANVEVAYLLQRLESFRGLTILTSNFKQNIDHAFVRRLRFVIDFALPTAMERMAIWDRAFPDGVLSERGREMFTIASRLPITGGSIQNIALHAAFLAAPHGGPVGIEHLLAATRRELLKMGMRSALSGLEDLLPVAVGTGEPDDRGAS